MPTKSPELPAKRIRRRKKAPIASTPKLLVYLESYLVGKSNRKQATMALLGCSERTAARITNLKTPYNSALRIDWVTRICAVVGRPVSSVLATKTALACADAVVGWAGSTPGSEAIQAAHDCAQAISIWAFENYGLSGDVIVAHREGIPTKVKISLSPNPSTAYKGGEYGYHHLIVTAKYTPGGKSQMWLRATEPGDRPTEERVIHNSRLSHQALRIQLIDIYDRTKNIARRLTKEFARRP